jgi:hypothetical protein
LFWQLFFGIGWTSPTGIPYAAGATAEARSSTRGFNSIRGLPRATDFRRHIQLFRQPADVDGAAFHAADL